MPECLRRCLTYRARDHAVPILGQLRIPNSLGISPLRRCASRPAWAAKSATQGACEIQQCERRERTPVAALTPTCRRISPRTSSCASSRVCCSTCRSQHDAAAVRRSARAAAAWMLRWRVVQRDLFARRNVAKRKEQHVPACHAAEAIRRTRVINERGRIPSAARVDAPVVIELANADLAAFCDSSGCFPVADPLAEEFADLLAAPKRNCSETAPPIDSRLAGDQLRRVERHAGASASAGERQGSAEHGGDCPLLLTQATLEPCSKHEQSSPCQHRRPGGRLGHGRRRSGQRAEGTAEPSAGEIVG